jgi:peptidoglycan/LPS O-acetylase OafA/YrhL
MNHREHKNIGQDSERLITRSPLHLHNKRYDIQVLRAVAIILVISNHAKVPFCTGGFIGVDVFFVISGFVITESLLRPSDIRIYSRLIDFYVKRIRRIIPAASLTLAATVIVAYCVLRNAYPTNLNVDVRWASLFSENIHLVKTGSNYLIPGIAPSLVTQFWSLAVEEQFYLVYPVLFLSTIAIAPKRFRMHSLRIFLIAGITTSAWWSWKITGTQQIASYYSPFTRFWELGIGGFVALLPEQWKIKQLPINIFISLAATTALIYELVKLNDQSAYPGVIAWIPCIATVLLLLTGKSGQKWSGYNSLSVRPIRYIGDISYSLYLFHYAWLIFPEYLPGFQNNAMDRIGEVSCSFICAALSYHLIENPIRNSKKLKYDKFASFLLLPICIAITWNATLFINYSMSSK